MYHNRIEAAGVIAHGLQQYKDCNGVVVAIPKGGLPIGHVIAETLNLPLEVVLSKKIGHPNQKEYAIGAVSLQGRIITDDTGITQEYIEKETRRIRELLQHQQAEYYGDRHPSSFTRKIVIVVDDGVATGNTILSTVELIQEQSPAKIIIAVPVGAPESIEMLKAHPHIQEVICPGQPASFGAVGQWYEDFHSVSSEEAIQYFRKSYHGEE